MKLCFLTNQNRKDLPTPISRTSQFTILAEMLFFTVNSEIFAIILFSGIA